MKNYLFSLILFLILGCSINELNAQVIQSQLSKTPQPDTIIINPNKDNNFIYTFLKDKSNKISDYIVFNNHTLILCNEDTLLYLLDNKSRKIADSLILTRDLENIKTMKYSTNQKNTKTIFCSAWGFKIKRLTDSTAVIGEVKRGQSYYFLIIKIKNSKLQYELTKFNPKKIFSTPFKKNEIKFNNSSAINEIDGYYAFNNNELFSYSSWVPYRSKKDKKPAFSSMLLYKSSGSEYAQPIFTLDKKYYIDIPGLDFQIYDNKIFLKTTSYDTLYIYDNKGIPLNKVSLKEIAGSININKTDPQNNFINYRLLKDYSENKLYLIILKIKNRLLYSYNIFELRNNSNTIIETKLLKTIIIKNPFISRETPEDMCKFTNADKGIFYFSIYKNFNYFNNIYTYNSKLDLDKTNKVYYIENSK